MKERSRWAIVIGACALGFGPACAPRRDHPKVVVPTSAPASRAAPWCAVPLPPAEHEARGAIRLPLANGSLLLGRSGDRWFYPRGGQEGTPAPQHAPHVDTVQITNSSIDPAGGLFVVSEAGELFIARDVLGPLESFGLLPAGATAESLRFHRGGVAALARGGAFVLARGKAPRAVPTLAGQEIGDARLGPDGRGAVLFLPESAAWTRDFGESYQPIPLAGIQATSFGDDRGGLSILPGGVRDGFPREIDEETGALSRALPPAEPPRLEPLPSVPNPGNAMRLAPDPLYGNDRFSATISGDEALTLLPRIEGATLHASIFRGRLGEGQRPIDHDTLVGCIVQASAICDERVAVACGHELFVFEGARLSRKLPFPLDNAALAFDEKGAPFAVGRSEAGGSAHLAFARFDLAASPETALSPTPVEDLSAAAPRLTGGCHAPALWLSTDHARRWSASSRAFEPAVALPAAGRPVAVRYDGSLVVSDGEALTFVPSLASVSVKKHGIGQLAFAEDGRHALLSSPSGQIWQSDDGGERFSPIVSPSVREPLPVICGRTRCQLGSGAFREGFARDADPVTPWIEPTPPAPTPTTDPPPVVVMTCKEDPSLFAGSTSGLLTPRLGPVLYAGITDQAARPSTSVWGDREGNEIRRELPSLPRTPSDLSEIRLSFVGTGANTVTVFGEAGATTTALFRWEARSPVQTLVHTEARPTFDARFLAENGVLIRLGGPGQLLFWGGAAPEKRPYPRYLGHGESDGGDGEGGGIMARDGDDNWLVAHDLDPQRLRLDRVEKAGSSVSRTILFRSAGALETGVGFATVGGVSRLYAIEGTPEGGAELRWRELGADLSLGPPHGVPGTRVAAGHLLDLPSCGPSPQGALVRISSLRTVGIRTIGHTGAERALLARLLRVDEKGACVERTFVPLDWSSLLATKVMAGNGGITAEAGGSGLRCGPVEPVDVRSVDRSKAPLRALRR